MLKKIIFASILLISFSNASWFSGNDKTKIDEQHYKNSVNLEIKEKINSIFEKFKNQSVVADKNIIYYRPDPIYRKAPKVFKIWTRADVVSFEHGKYYYIIPEGYKTIYEKEGEIYIDYQPTAQSVKLDLENDY